MAAKSIQHGNSLNPSCASTNDLSRKKDQHPFKQNCILIVSLFIWGSHTAFQSWESTVTHSLYGEDLKHTKVCNLQRSSRQSVSTEAGTTGWDSPCWIRDPTELVPFAASQGRPSQNNQGNLSNSHFFLNFMSPFSKLN